MGPSWPQQILCGLKLQRSFESGKFAIMEIIALLSIRYRTGSEKKKRDHASCGAGRKSDGLSESREKEASYLMKRR